MTEPQMPDLDDDLATRIRLVRRDMSSLLFHFTRGANGMPAGHVLKKILGSGTLLGTGTWTRGTNCVCFTEAPIPEFTAIFSLVNIAASHNLRPRYEPYGIAFHKDWLFRQGGRPVIYEQNSKFHLYSSDQDYRMVPFDPDAGIDYTWEREWRIKTNELSLDSNHALVVVPTAKEAFDIMDLSVAPPNLGGTTASYDVQERFRMPTWMAVSLDLFGVQF